MAKIIHMPRIITGGAHDRCAACNRGLQAHFAQLQRDGTLLCLPCVGSRATLPPEVVETLEQMEREHGHKQKR